MAEWKKQRGDERDWRCRRGPNHAEPGGPDKVSVFILRGIWKPVVHG